MDSQEGACKYMFGKGHCESRWPVDPGISAKGKAKETGWWFQTYVSSTPI